MSKERKKNKNLKYILLGVLVFLAAGWMALSRIDFLGDMVLSQVESAVQGLGGVELEISPLRGNPVTGFEGDHLALKRGGETLLSADRVDLRISLPSVLTGSPRVALLHVDGLRTDFASLMAMLPETQDAGPVDIPVNKIALDRSIVDTPWGALELDGSSVRLKGTEWFDLDLNGSFDRTHGGLSGVVEKKSGNWSADGLRLKVAEGTIRLDGAFWPQPDLKAQLEGVDLGEAAGFVPQLRKAGLRGRLSGEAAIVGLGDAFAVSGDASLLNALIYGVPFPEVAADWSYQKNLLRVSLREGRVFKSSLSGDLTLDTRQETGYLSLDARVRDLRFDDWAETIPDLPGAADFGGAITSLDVKLDGPLNALVGKVALAPSSFRYKTLEINHIQGQALFAGKPSGDVGFTADYLGQKLSLAGTLSFAQQVASKLTFDAGSLPLDQLDTLFEIPEAFKPQGRAAVKATLSGPPGSWVVRGDVSSNSISVAALGTFTNVRAAPQLQFADGSLTLEHAAVVWNGAHITGRGDLRNAAADLDFSGAFEHVDTARFHKVLPVLETLGIETVAAGTWQIGGTLDEPVVTAHARAHKGVARGVAAQDLETTITYVPGLLTLNPLRGKAGGGTVDLVCIVNIPQNLQSGAKVSWELSGQVSKVDPAIANALLGADEELGGSVSGTVMAGDIGDGIRWSFNAAGTEVRWRAFKADEASGVVYGDTSTIRVDEFQVGFLRSKTTVQGVIDFPPAGEPVSEASLDLRLHSDNMNIYELLRRHLPAVRGFQGLVDTEIAVSGTLGDPQFSGSSRFAPFRYRRFFLPRLDVTFAGDINKIDVNAAARLIYGSLDATAQITQQDGQWNGAVDVAGSEIDLVQLGFYLPEEFREKLNGKADVQMHGAFKNGDFSADGTFSSQELTAFGVSVENIRAPFYITDGYAIMEDVRATSNGGTFEGGVAYNMADDSWGSNVTIASVDIGSLLKEAAPEMKGAVTGRAGMRVRAAGDMGRTSTVKAAGVLTLNNGDISGFDAVVAAEKYTRGNPIRFDTVQASFNLDEGYLTILPGSQAIAPPNDPVYRNVMLDGMVDNRGSLSMFCMGKVNIRALNALLGAVQGLMNMNINLNEALNKEELLQGLLTGMVGGFSQSEFRFFTMNVKGTLFSPKFEDIQVENTSTLNTQDIIPRAPSDPKEDSFASGNTTFRFQFKIPVGPGGRSKTTGVDDQVKGQMLQNALEGLIEGISF